MLVVAYYTAHSVHLLSPAPKCMFLQTVYKCAAFSDKTRCYRSLRRGVDTLFSHGGLWSCRLICPLAPLPLATVSVVQNGLVVARFHAGCSKYGVERSISFVNENIVRKLIEIWRGVISIIWHLSHHITQLYIPGEFLIWQILNSSDETRRLQQFPGFLMYEDFPTATWSITRRRATPFNRIQSVSGTTPAAGGSMHAQVDQGL